MGALSGTWIGSLSPRDGETSYEEGTVEAGRFPSCGDIALSAGRKRSGLKDMSESI